ncbi:hypothetical protein DEJ44_20410 [Streptomyces venezuelae]|nr:hypothetical protein DEJ44_20410 [Streptomyces venezuelae]
MGHPRVRHPRGGGPCSSRGLRGGAVRHRRPRGRGRIPFRGAVHVRTTPPYPPSAHSRRRSHRPRLHGARGRPGPGRRRLRRPGSGEGVRGDGEVRVRTVRTASGTSSPPSGWSWRWASPPR